MTSKKEKVIGIDLGTTNSVVAIVENGQPVVIPTAEGGRLCPSVVSFNPDGTRVVGQLAKRQAIANAENTVIEIKRKMGSNYKVKILGKEYTPQEISAMILQKLKADAEAYLGEPVKKAVITVPAYFNDAQRQATKDAGRIAGLEVLRIINEPTAAALAYGLDKSEEEQTVAVLDLGGGTFDVSILEVGEGVVEVKATSGDNHLGGSDFDQRIMDWLIEDFKAKHGIDLSKDRMALQRLKEAAEQAKIELSSMPKTRITLQYIAADASGPKHIDVELTRAQFEQMTADLIERAMKPTRQALKDSGLSTDDIDKVLLIGGATRMPMFQRAVKEFFGKEPYKGINPDEAVAIGAAIQAAVLAGEMKDILLLDVTPLSLGVETLGGVFTKIIERNTTIPVRKSQIFTTAADNQTQVEIHVLQGERAMAKDNISLGRFYLTGIPPAPRGVPKIEVTFDIDSNGIVHVSAKDLATGKEQKIVVQGRTNLSEEEIQKMVEEAQKYAEEDKKLKEKIETINQAESLVYTTRKSLEELGDKVSADDKKKVETKLQDLENAIKTEDVNKIKHEMDALQKVFFEISQKIYQATGVPPGAGQAQGAPGPGFNVGSTTNAGQNPKSDKTVDADYEVIEEE